MLVIPRSGYALSELTVTDADGNVLTLTANGDGTYSFTMPAGGVWLAASLICTAGLAMIIQIRRKRFSKVIE